MKLYQTGMAVFMTVMIASAVSAQTNNAGSVIKSGTGKGNHFYIDVHELGAGNVTAEAVAGAHAKDLATEKQFGVNFIKYWVDEGKGLVYCFSSSPDSASITHTHAKAHGLIPTHTYLVTEGQAARIKNSNDLYLDVHELGAGNVTAEAVAEAHKKDLAVQDKYGVSFINYWVDKSDGLVFCLAEAKDSASMVNTHKEAHGLIPSHVMKVKQGQ